MKRGRKECQPLFRVNQAPPRPAFASSICIRGLSEWSLRSLIDVCGISRLHSPPSVFRLEHNRESAKLLLRPHLCFATATSPRRPSSVVAPASFYGPPFPASTSNSRSVVWISRPASFSWNVLVRRTFPTYSQTALDTLFFLHSLSQIARPCSHRPPRPHRCSRQRCRHTTSMSPIQMYSQFSI